VIEPIHDLANGVIGMRAVGQFTMEDYSTVIEPALDKLEVSHEKLRLLLYLGPQFTGFGEGAWGELTDEIRNVHFHRGAVVTDDFRVRTGLIMLKWVLHGDVRTFHNDEYDRAASWVAG
jgi:SpoIIAA-like